MNFSAIFGFILMSLTLKNRNLITMKKIKRESLTQNVFFSLFVYIQDVQMPPHKRRRTKNLSSEYLKSAQRTMPLSFREKCESKGMTSITIRIIK